jgi:spore maturation protein CgeB
MKILYVGNLTPGSRSEQRRRALARLGHDVTALAYAPTLDSYAVVPRLSISDRVLHRLGRPRDVVGANRAFVAALRGERFDLVWVDKAPPLRPESLAAGRSCAPTTPFVFHSEDDHALVHNQWAWMRECFALYDVVWTTKPRNLDGELAALGARDVRFHFQTYDPIEHRPVQPTAAERDRYFADAGFIGTYEAERARSLAALADSGVLVRVFGNGWHRMRNESALLKIEPHQIAGRDYLAAMASSSLHLGFLRRANRDGHTSRSIEIPACGAVLVAERTEEHRRLFREDVEAVFFGSDEELIAKVHGLLEDPARRRSIAMAGRERCLASAYDHDTMLAKCLADVVPALDPAPAWEAAEEAA